jgi:hypothetical protein
MVGGWRPGSGEEFDQDFGASAAGVVAFATAGREVVGSAFGKAAFGLEVGEGLGGEGEKLGDAGFAGFGFDELQQLASDPLVFVGGTDVEVGEFGLFLFGIKVEGDTGDGVAVDLVEIVIAELPLDFGAGAFDDFGAVDGFAGEDQQLADVFFEGAADLLVFVGIDEGADAFVGEHLGEQGFVLATIDDVDAGYAGATGLGGVLGFGQEVRGKALRWRRRRSSSSLARI